MTSLATMLEERAKIEEDYGTVLESARIIESKGLAYESRRLYAAAEQIKRALHSIDTKIREEDEAACSDDDIG